MSASVTSVPIAPGIESDQASALLRTMQQAGAAGSGARVTYLEQIEGGWSRQSHAARIADDPADQERSYIVRVRPHGSTLDTDLGQEFRVYSLLMDEAVTAPRVHACEPSVDTPFGGAYFVMDRAEGAAPNVWRGRDRKRLAEDWAGPRRLAEEFVDNLAAIHAISPQRAAEAVTARDFNQVVDHWQAVYERARLVPDPVIDEAYRWVRAREPDPVPPALVHGDYRIGNCLIDSGRISAVLDWELCHVGDPRFDLGYLSLDYLAGKFTSPGSELISAVADREWLFERYARRSGRTVDREVVRTYAALGALMLFAIMTTGIGVYVRGESTDIRMAWARYVLPGLRQDLVHLMGW